MQYMRSPAPVRLYSPAPQLGALEKTTTGMLWIGLALVLAVGGIIYFNRQDAKMSS